MRRPLSPCGMVAGSGAQERGCEKGMGQGRRQTEKMSTQVTSSSPATCDPGGIEVMPGGPCDGRAFRAGPQGLFPTTAGCQWGNETTPLLPQGEPTWVGCLLLEEPLSPSLGSQGAPRSGLPLTPSWEYWKRSCPSPHNPPHTCPGRNSDVEAR